MEKRKGESRLRSRITTPKSQSTFLDATSRLRDFPASRASRLSIAMIQIAGKNARENWVVFVPPPLSPPFRVTQSVAAGGTPKSRFPARVYSCDPSLTLQNGISLTVETATDALVIKCAVAVDRARHWSDILKAV